MPPSVVVRWHSSDVEPERIDAVAQALSLSRHPDGEPVPVQIERRAEGGEAPAIRLVLRPEAPLEDRWYLLRLDPVPEGITIVGDAMTTPDGAAGARFRTGAEVVTRSVRACSDAAGGVVLTATLSERIAMTEGQRAMRVRQGGEILECAPLDREAPREEKGHPATAGEIRVRCPGAESGAPLEIALAGDARVHRLRGAFRPATAGAPPDRPADDACEVLRPDGETQAINPNPTR
jgi:hypothetical protein